MTESLNRDDAARSIEHVRRREQQVITATAIPLWYWWVVGAGTLVLGVVADGRRPAVIAVTAVLFGAATAALTLWVIPGAGSGARVSRDLLGGGGPASIVGFVGSSSCPGSLSPSGCRRPAHPARPRSAPP